MTRHLDAALDAVERMPPVRRWLAIGAYAVVTFAVGFSISILLFCVMSE